jgi:hypothetical protein
MSGYSATPLAKKLGIKPGSRIRTSGAPANYRDLLQAVPSNVTISTRLSRSIDIWHLFTGSSKELSLRLPALKEAIAPDGAIWISWPKKSSGVKSSVTEDTIRAVAIPLGLVDIKVCAIDDVWSGLKLVIRKELRKKSPST